MKPTVIATSRFERSAKRLLTEEGRAALQDAIAADPQFYPVVRGTGGVRKARFARRGTGKEAARAFVEELKHAKEESRRQTGR